MTHDQTTPAPVEVTQADINAVNQHAKNKMCFGETLEEAFARHRIAHYRIAHSAPAPVEVTREDYDRAIEVFNDSLCDMGNYVEFGAPQYKHEVLETIASHCARHRIAHSAPASEVEPVAWMYTHPKCTSYWRTQPDQAHAEDGWTETPLYTHPAPPADVVELVEALRNCLATGLPEEVASAARAALAKHGGA